MSGISSLNVDLKETSDGDLIRTVIFMLAGIFIIFNYIITVDRHAIYLTLSLILTYFTSVGLTDGYSKHFLATTVSAGLSHFSALSFLSP
ncbi:hypothetical protein ABFY43_20750 [Bacillus pumilus]